MKKLFVLALVFALLLSGCSKEPQEIVLNIPETPGTESSESLPEEKPQEEPSEPIPEEEPETEDEWEKFIEEKMINGYTREEIESLETHGFSRDEIMTMQWVDFSRNLSMIEFGFERKKVEETLELLKSGNLKDDETFVLSGDNTIRFELIEDFISSVERNEAAFVHGTMAGNPLYFYFELSYEPGGLIEYSLISEYQCSKTEFSEIYDTEVFCRFMNEEKSLTFPKIELWPGEQLKFSSEQDIPGMSVTLEEAKEKATETMFWSCLANDEYEFTEEYLSSFEPKCNGIFDIAGKPYYRIGFYKGESPDGGTYYICAEESSVVFAGSEVDGRLIPIVRHAEPRVVLETE